MGAQMLMQISTESDFLGKLCATIRVHFLTLGYFSSSLISRVGEKSNAVTFVYFSKYCLSVNTYVRDY